MIIIIGFLIALISLLYLFNKKQRIDKHKYTRKPRYYPLLKNALSFLVPLVLLLSSNFL